MGHKNIRTKLYSFISNYHINLLICYYVFKILLCLYHFVAELLTEVEAHFLQLELLDLT